MYNWDSFPKFNFFAQDVKNYGITEIWSCFSIKLLRILQYIKTSYCVLEFVAMETNFKVFSSNSYHKNNITN